MKRKKLWTSWEKDWFDDLYVTSITQPLDSLKIQTSEVEQVTWLSIKDAQKISSDPDYLDDDILIKAQRIALNMI